MVKVGKETEKEPERIIRYGAKELGKAIVGGATKITLLDEGSLITSTVRVLRRDTQAYVVRALNEKIMRGRPSGELLSRLERYSMDEAITVDAQAALNAQFAAIQVLGDIIKKGSYVGRSELERHLYSSLTPQHYSELTNAIGDIRFRTEDKEDEELSETKQAQRNRSRYGLVLLSQPEVRSFFRRTSARDLLRFTDPVNAFEDAMLYVAAFEWI